MSVVLSEHLPLLASAPAGIQKLRGLILELAVRGKLVPQDPNDEPASELLKRIANERVRLEAEGVCKKSKATPLSGDEMWPSALPPAWSWTNLAAIALINPRNAADDSTEASFVPMAMIGSRFEGSHEHEARKWSEIKQGFTHFAEGDVGVAKITPCFENSKACVFTNLRNGIGAGTTELHIVRPLGNTLSPRYVLAYLKAPMFLSVGEIKMTGTAGQKRLPKDFLETNPFPLPPLAEQHRIVAKVDELMALCDRLEAEQADSASAHARLVETLLGTLTQSTDAADLAANWQRLAEHFDVLFVTESSIDRLKQTILELAVTGKLLAQNDTDRPVSEALNEMELAGGSAKVRRGVATVANSLVYDPPRPLPSAWSAESIARLLQLGAIVDVKDGNHGANHPKVSEFSAIGLPFITAAQVSENGAIDYDGAYKVSGAPLGKLRVGFAHPADVIYTHKGSVGRVAICDRDCVLTPQTTYYRLNPSVIHNHFFAYFLRSPSFRNQVDVVKRQTTRDFVSISAQYEFFCHIPPIKEQIRIFRRVDELMALCERLKSDLGTARHRQATLADTLIESALEVA